MTSDNKEPEVVMTNRLFLLPELVNMLYPFQYPQNKALSLEYALYVQVFLYTKKMLDYTIQNYKYFLNVCFFY